MIFFSVPSLPNHRRRNPYPGFLLLAGALILSACGGGGGGSTPTPATPAANPAPTITTLSPASATVGAAAQTLTINGSNFMSGSTVTYNGTAHTATYVSSSQLTISLTASDQATAGQFAVVVTNPTPGGGASNSVQFDVNNPTPAITTLSPAAATAGAGAQTLTINGSNFLSGATVTYNGTAHAATYVSATELTIDLTASDEATAGQFAVVVTNPSPGGGASNSVNFDVNNPAPAIAALSPASTYPCDPVQTLTITGTNFLAGSTVSFNGSSLAATYVSATELTISLPSAAISTPGSDAVVVTNPGPGGGASNSTAFVVNTPAGPTLSGTTAMGATVQVYDLNADLSSGTLECTSTSDASTGAFSMTMNAALSGGVRLVSSSGQIQYDSANGAVNYPQTTDETAIFGSVPASGISSIDLDPISSFADVWSQHVTVSGSQQPHAVATADMDELYGFSQSTPVEIAPTNTADQNQRLAAVQGYLTEGLALNSKSPDDLFGALQADLQDGTWDGYDLGTGQVVALGSGTLPISAGTMDYLDSTVAWVNGAGATVLPAGAGAAVVAKLTKGLAGSNFVSKSSVGLMESTSGAIETFEWQGHQYLVINDGNPGTRAPLGVVVVDITDPTAAAPAVKVWTWGDLGGLFGGGSVDSDGGLTVIAGNQSYPEVFVYDGGADWAMLNAATLITGTPGTDNPVEASGSFTFVNGSSGATSTGGATVDGATWDGCWNGCQIELATPDGYAAFNYSTDQLDETHLYKVEDANEFPAENIAGYLAGGVLNGTTNAQDSILLAGNRGGLQLVDYTSGASYYLPANTFSSYFPNFPFALATNDIVDGNAIDLNERVAILTPEQESGSNDWVGFMALDGLTETSGGGAGLNALTPPAGGAQEVQLDSAGVGFTGASSAAGMVTFKGPNGSTYVAVGELNAPSASALQQGTWTALNDWVFYNVAASPSLASYVDQGDPHGVLTVESLAGGSGHASEPYGYVLDASGHGVVQMDLYGLLNMPRQGSSGDPAHEVTGDPAAATSATTGAAVLREITW